MTNNLSAFVIKLALILIFSILPSLVYLLIFRQAKKRWQMRLRRAQTATNYQAERLPSNIYDYERDAYLENSDRRRSINKYFIGDTSCANNAQSPYLRCAINPEGPCEECSHYEQRYPQN